MKVILDNINYKGHHFEKIEFELPEHIKTFEEIPEGKLEEYVKESLNEVINFQKEEA